MSNELIERHANLNDFPASMPEELKKSHVSVGDMHGNALKLIYILIEEGFLKIHEEDFVTLRNIYNKEANQLTKAELMIFEKVINEAEVDTTRSLTLIGDELADRGNNDLLTLFVLKKLCESKLDVDILVSNHSAEFLHDYEKPEFSGKHALLDSQGQSLTNMHRLIKRGLISEDDVRQMVQTTYQPMVKGISYTLSEDGRLSLFSHAPIGLETVEALAEKFSIPYREETPLMLITTINAINERIQDHFFKKQLAQLIDKEGYFNSSRPIPLEKPLLRLVWNRVLGPELRTKPRANNFQINFVHGHIGDGQLRASHQNLDTLFGKSREFFKTGLFGAYGQVNVSHYTRQSDAFTSKQLESDPALLKDIQKKQFNQAMQELIQKSQEFQNRDPESPAAIKCKTMVEELAKHAEKYFTSNEIHLNDFVVRCNKTIAEATPELKNHRGFWYSNVPQAIRTVLGVLSAFPCFFIGIGISLFSRQGYQQTFFSKPETDSMAKISQFKNSFETILGKGLS